MTVEDRLRDTAEAVTAAMRPVRPLDLHPGPDLIGAPAKSRRPRRSHRWSAWLVPLAAAAAVVAVAATLVAVRGSSGTGSAARTTPAAGSSSSVGTSGGIPPYYVTLNQVAGTAKWGAVLGDTSTGKALVTVKPPANGSWQGVATSANDSTFVLYGGVGSTKTGQPTAEVFDVLRVPAGAPQRTQPTQLTLAGSYANGVSQGGTPGSQRPVITAVAVSPDGQTAAVFSQQVTQTKNVQSTIAPAKAGAPSKTISTTVPTSEETTLRTFSLATGQVLRAWTGSGSFFTAGGNGLSWLADGHTLSWFTRSTSPSATPGDLPAVHWDLQTLNIASPGTSLAADSHTVFHILDDTACQSPLLTLDGKSVICDRVASGPQTCGKGDPELVSYSVATGKLENVLYRYESSCQFGDITPMWAPSGSLVIGERDIIVSQTTVNKYTHTKLVADVGVMTPVKFTPLPITQTGATNGSGAFAAF